LVPRRQPSFAKQPSFGELRLDLAEAVAKEQNLATA
jgi:hypothetical protein